MPHEITFELIVHFGLEALLAALIIAGFMRYFEKALGFKESYLIALVACAISFAVYVAYMLARPELGVPRFVDGLLSLPLMMLTGAIITRLSANYGIKKTGWFGLGGRVMLAMYAVMAVIAAVTVLLMSLYGR